MSKTVRVDGTGCNGCYNLWGLVMPNGEMVNYCSHAFLVDRPKDGVLRMSYHVVGDPSVRLPECPIGD
jgi:hypothetical protein